ncbi:MAG: 50S ribosomal protein L11 methyltransferase [Chloroflexi bacterium]|nr:50S ribosomal protein L11 methyltransferase [Chloroflexota bacterium]
MDWVEISVEVDEEAVEAVAEQLRSFGQGVAIDVPFVQPSLYDDALTDRSRRAIVKTYLPDDGGVEDARRQIEQALWHLGRLRPVGELALRPVAEEDWANAWKEFYSVVHVGQRTVIVPAWLRYRRRPNDIVIRLDPGLAFGTGTHPTTRLCLQAMESRASAAKLVLDVGTGSGILAIAACRLGAPKVHAVDIDPMAAKAAKANIKLNHLSRQIRVYEGDADASAGSWAGQTYDLILSNVTARVNIRLAGLLAGLLAPDGEIIASGILREDLKTVVDAFGAVGLQTRERLYDEDWGALVVGR